MRWLLSTVPTSMIFDDHDVRDDWNTSQSWRDDMQAKSWWQERIVGALSSYWVYQHLGNLSPAELADNELYQRVRGFDGDAEQLVREFAAAADREADGAKGARWSYRRDFGSVRLLVIDSRCGRILDQGRRSMLSEAEFDWIEEQLTGDYEHLLIGTSLPWLLPRAFHDIEAWNELLCDGHRGAAGRRGLREDPPGRGFRALGGVPGVVRATGHADRRGRRAASTPRIRRARAGDGLRAVRRRPSRLRRPPRVLATSPRRSIS